jgi:hypothetical protein
MYLVSNTVVRLCQFFCCGRKINFVQIPYSHDRFPKISRTFFVKKIIPYKTYVREDHLFLALYGSTTIQSWLFLKNVKIFVWVPKQYLLGFFILKKQLANIPDRGFLFLRNTLLLCSLCPYSQTEWQTETHTCFAWAGGTFFPVVLLCQFSVLVGNRCWFYILLMYLEYYTVVVLC